MTDETQQAAKPFSFPDPILTDAKRPTSWGQHRPSPAVGGVAPLPQGVTSRPEGRFSDASLEPVRTKPAAVQGAESRRQNGDGAMDWQAARRRARRTAVQTLYEIDCTDHKPGVALEYRQAAEQFSTEIFRFLYWLVSGVLRHQADLDSLIGRYAPEWPVQQLAIVDRNVLRLSIFELTSPDADAPAKVVINEAVELAKTFGSDSSPRFVNGVLATALRELS